VFFQLLIQLWTVLFTLIGVSLFADIFRTVPFSTLSYATVFGYGLAIGKENAHITNALRYITLAVFSVLMPLLAVIALLFLFTLPLTGLQSLWATKYASPSTALPAGADSPVHQMRSSRMVRERCRIQPGCDVVWIRLCWSCQSFVQLLSLPLACVSTNTGSRRSVSTLCCSR